MISKEDWLKALENVQEAVKINCEFIGEVGVEPCLAIHHLHKLLVQYNSRIRTKKLYDEMINAE